MSTFPSPTRREALLQAREGQKVRCLTCERRCLLTEGGQGWCRTRVNQRHKLYTLTYGAVSSLSANPIEKKPFYHFYPGSTALTVGSWSCNFGCPWCQNWDITKQLPPPAPRFMSPQEMVDRTLQMDCQGTSISFNEPTLSFEWSLEVFRLAHRQGLYNTYVTNGYMTAQALELLAQAGLDALNIDMKGYAAAVHKYCKGIDVERVWARCKQARQLGLHLEITTLLIPGVNDSPDSLHQIAQRIARQLSPEIAWHVSGYYPAYRFHTPPTTVASLQQAHDIGVKAGLKYVYLGNVLGHPYNHTYCPGCGNMLIQRLGFRLLSYSVVGGRCPSCGCTIDGVGWDWRTPRS